VQDRARENARLSSGWAEPCSHDMVRTLIPSKSPIDGRRVCLPNGVLVW
jgi:hypothetical protein